jgi:hypothetical protein
MKTHTCKYCGAKTSSREICANCRPKLELVRTLLAMVRAKKEEIDRIKAQRGER